MPGVRQFPSSFTAISDRMQEQKEQIGWVTAGREQREKERERETREWDLESKSDNHDDEDCHECLGMRPAGAENLTEFSSRTRRRATQILPSASSAFPPFRPRHSRVPALRPCRYSHPRHSKNPPALSRRNCYPPITYKPHATVLCA